MFGSRNNADFTLQLIALLGDTLARVQAAHAKEEYALSQIVASLKFVNHTVDSWVNSSQEEAELSQFHVYESDLSAVSKSIDAVLDEARLVRGSSKRANPKGATSTPDNAITHKSKVAEQKKTLERFSQALHMRPTKTVSTDLGEDADRPSPFSPAHEMLLRWMESNKQRSFHIVAKQKHEKSVERSNPARRFLDSLWTIRGSPDVSETKVWDAPGGAVIEMTSEDDGSSTAPTVKQVETVRHRAQKNVEELQTLCKRHLQSELLSPHKTISNALERDLHHHVGNEEESAEGSSWWLPARVCWRVLGMQGKGIMMDHEKQLLPTLYSHLQQPLATMRLMHSIHTNIFHCYLQLLLTQCFFHKTSSQTSKRIGNVLSNSNVYMCFRLAHCLVYNNKALFIVARRVDLT